MSSERKRINEGSYEIATCQNKRNLGVFCRFKVSTARLTEFLPQNVSADDGIFNIVFVTSAGDTILPGRLE